MATQIALLRAVNVGGTGKVSMSALCAAACDAGLRNVRTLLNSGNLVFDAGVRSPAATEKLLEAMCHKTFGLAIDTYVRTPDEIAALTSANPFKKQALETPAMVHVLFLRTAPPASAYAALNAAIKGRETIAPGARHAYIHYPDGAGNSKLTPAVLARYLGQSGTARNWNTVRKLYAAAQP